MQPVYIIMYVRFKTIIELSIIALASVHYRGRAFDDITAYKAAMLRGKL